MTTSISSDHVHHAAATIASDRPVYGTHTIASDHAHYNNVGLSIGSNLEIYEDNPPRLPIETSYRRVYDPDDSKYDLEMEARAALSYFNALWSAVAAKQWNEQDRELILLVDRAYNDIDEVLTLDGKDSSGHWSADREERLRLSLKTRKAVEKATEQYRAWRLGVEGAKRQQDQGWLARAWGQFRKTTG